jgi:ADP-ribose pyrophosphatase YjhB (NUDIX family)
MIRFDHGEYRFNYRTVGIVLRSHDILIHKWEHDDFWALPGGRVEFLETSEEALRREMREELGEEVTAVRLVWVVENFFRYRGKSCHELAHYYLVRFSEDSELYSQNGYFEGDDEGIQLTFRWQDIDALEGVHLYPTFLKKSLNSIPRTIEHIVHTDPSSPADSTVKCDPVDNNDTNDSNRDTDDTGNSDPVGTTDPDDDSAPGC